MTDTELEVHRFEHHFDEHNIRSVSVEADLGDDCRLEISENYNPAIEDVDQVVARCADDLRLLIRRRGR